MKKSSLIYKPASRGSVFQESRAAYQGMAAGWGLGLQLAKRDISAMYRQSVLGLLWAVITPIAQTLVWVFLSNRGVIDVKVEGVGYAAFVLTGIMFWQALMESLNAPLAMFNSSKGILRKLNINKESLIVAGLLKVLFNLGIKLLVLLILLVLMGWSPSLQTLWAIPCLVLVLLMGTAVGVLLTPLGALFNDVQRIIMSFSQLLFFLTPIIYPPRDEGLFGLIDRWNPAAISIGATRDLFLGLGFDDVQPVLYLGLFTLVLLSLAMVLYRISIPIIVERMGS